MTIPRRALADANHRDIDAILKDLKSCSRHVRSALNSFKDELCTLERLYYKCKNQHRAALFFKRVAEMRRYGRRLCDLDVSERVDLLRASFVGLTHTRDHKALRGTWTHVPEKPHIYSLTEILTTGSALVCKMRERLENAYHHFTLAMQTGAFIQLEEAFQSTLSICDRLSAIVHQIGVDATTPQQLPSESETLHSSHIDYEVPLEDTEQPASCSEPTAPTPVVEDQGSKMETTLETHVTPPPAHPTIASGHTTATVRAVRKSRPKKAKKKLDEIDEIFGF